MTKRDEYQKNLHSFDLYIIQHKAISDHHPHINQIVGSNLGGASSNRKCQSVKNGSILLAST